MLTIQYSGGNWGDAVSDCQAAGGEFDFDTETCVKTATSAAPGIVSTTAASAPTVTPIAPTATQPFFKKPLFWAIAGTVVVVGGAVLITRK